MTSRKPHDQNTVDDTSEQNTVVALLTNSPCEHGVHISNCSKQKLQSAKKALQLSSSNFKFPYRSNAFRCSLLHRFIISNRFFNFQKTPTNPREVLLPKGCNFSDCFTYQENTHKVITADVFQFLSKSRGILTQKGRLIRLELFIMKVLSQSYFPF